MTAEVIKRKITYNNGRELIVEQAPYAYMENANKVVLKNLVINADNVKFEDVAALKENKGDIVYWEQIEKSSNDGSTASGEWQQKNIFSGYTLAEEGLLINYQNGVYTAELRRQDKFLTQIETNVSDVAQLRADTEYIALMAGIEL